MSLTFTLFSVCFPLTFWLPQVSFIVSPSSVCVCVCLAVQASRYYFLSLFFSKSSTYIHSLAPLLYLIFTEQHRTLMKRILYLASQIQLFI